MKRAVWALVIAMLAVSLLVSAAPQNKTNETPLPWAYNTNGTPLDPNPTWPDKTIRHTADSNLGFTDAQVHDRYGPADWHPGDHATMPNVVAHGKKPEVWACSLCHLPNGQGRPENAGVAGLPVEYFIKQMTDFKSGLRNSADPKKTNTARMIDYTKNMSEAEIRAAATYFGSISYKKWVKVVEASSVPKTHVDNGLSLKLEGGGTEPLGNRILEVPDNTEAAEGLRDDHAGFTAYVPIGSVKKGEDLVTTGGGITIACGVCHGASLRGVGPVPPLAGRSPSYLARQLYDMQHGTRYGSWSALMVNAVAKLNADDIVSICAYIASLPPTGMAAKP
jgi:cytochrome c553